MEVKGFDIQGFEGSISKMKFHQGVWIMIGNDKSRILEESRTVVFSQLVKHGLMRLALHIGHVIAVWSVIANLCLRRGSAGLLL